MRKAPRKRTRKADHDEQRPEYRFDYAKSRPNRFARRGIREVTTIVLDLSGERETRVPEEALIRGLQERNADRKRATDGYLHPPRPIPPVAAKNLRVLERVLGFKLPELLRAVYTRVGNGGFGPAYGIVGTTKAGQSCYQGMLQLEKENAIWRWPRSLLPLADYGCGMWACADCEYKTLPMILWDPNNLDEELAGVDARLNWAYAFWDQGLSLRTWLEGWLKGKPEPEPKRPRDSWMRKRLGFASPK